MSAQNRAGGVPSNAGLEAIFNVTLRGTLWQSAKRATVRHFEGTRNGSGSAFGGRVIHRPLSDGRECFGACEALPDAAFA